MGSASTEGNSVGKKDMGFSELGDSSCCDREDTRAQVAISLCEPKSERNDRLLYICTCSYGKQTGMGRLLTWEAISEKETTDCVSCTGATEEPKPTIGNVSALPLFPPDYTVNLQSGKFPWAAW